jgi:SWI/SNF-related matrix-associated actin-dependent regulator 1 of chromatin subfamily A
MVPFPHQLAGAKFLASRKTALLADLPRVGKTGTAIIAADYVNAANICVVTTASGRAVWRRGLADWSAFDRSDATVVGWPSVGQPDTLSGLLRQKWDLLILDESHFAKNPEAKRTIAAYMVAKKAERVWCLSGSPIPNAPNDLFPMMQALCPERLKADGELPDVSTYPAFLKRYCVVKPKKIGWHRWIDVVIGGRNLDELKARLDGFVLRRTQQDVGIREPLYDTFPLLVSDKVKREAQAGLDTAAVLAAAESGDTKALEMHLGPLRRLTGEIKARAAVEALKEEFECGLDKIVLMAWHKDVMQILRDGLGRYGVVGIDGSTPSTRRTEAIDRFRDDPKIRVFIGQIQAAGEAIDLSAAATLWFVESSFTPKDMLQASLRITNHSQARQALVRVCVLDGSIDEALQTILLRKWQAIREVMTNA